MDLKPIIDRIGSGRFWLVIISGWVFAWASVHGKLTPEAITAIVTMVYVSYFQRNDRNGGNGGKPA